MHILVKWCSFAIKLTPLFNTIFYCYFVANIKLYNPRILGGKFVELYSSFLRLLLSLKSFSWMRRWSGSYYLWTMTALGAIEIHCNLSKFYNLFYILLIREGSTSVIRKSNGVWPHQAAQALLPLDCTNGQSGAWMATNTVCFTTSSRVLTIVIQGFSICFHNWGISGLLFPLYLWNASLLHTRTLCFHIYWRWAMPQYMPRPRPLQNMRL